MNYINGFENAPILYSCCSGYNFYFSDGNQTREVFNKRKRIIRHVKTGAYFYITPFPDDLNSNFELDYWTQLIQNPVDFKHYIWPVDVVALPTDDGEAKKYALVFALRAMPVFETISGLFSDDKQVYWSDSNTNNMRFGGDKKWVQDLTFNLLNAWCHFDDSNYAYHEFSFDNIFYRSENYDVMFDFSFSTQKTDELYKTHYVNKKRIVPDFADSYYYLENRYSLMDLASDYYSMAVILFKLLIGRLPYHGKVMANEPNSDKGEHKNWLKIYHKNTYFIFDEKDYTNRIGGEKGFASDEVFVDRWNNLPIHIRNMFHNVFQNANVLRTADELIFYSPKQWKEALFGEPLDVELSYRAAGTQFEQPIVASSLAEDIQEETAPASAVVEDKPESVDKNPKKRKNIAENLVNVIKSKFTEVAESAGYHDVIITEVPQSGRGIEVVNEITGLGLASVKELFENTPCPIAQGISAHMAEQLQNELALVEVKTLLSANSQHNEQIEGRITERMQGRWRSKSNQEEEK